MSGHEQHRPLTGADDWDERYRGESDENMWSGEPNGALVAEVSSLRPGKAVDLGCGEGADAIWLATRGWEVTGVDISKVALERARKAADAAGVEVEWISGDFVGHPPSTGAYDLVTTHYPALLRANADEAVEAVLAGVAPGGTLLFVTHLITDPEAVRSHGFEPDDYVDIHDVVRRLGDGWTVEVHETRSRESGFSEQSPHADDVVLRARRDR